MEGLFDWRDIGIYQVADAVGHRRGQGRHSPHNYIYRLRLKGFGPEADLQYRAHQVPQCRELIAAYRAQHQLETITHPASKDGKPLGSDTAPKDSSPLETESAIHKRKSRSGSNKEKNNREEEKVNDAIRYSHVNDAIRHSHVNDGIRRLHTALT